MSEWISFEDQEPFFRGDYGWCRIAWGPEDDKCTGDAMFWKDRWFVASCFYRGGGRDSRQYEWREYEVTPTHWMPLPEPPQ